MSRKKQGKRTILLEHCPYVASMASVVGRMEGEGPKGTYFDETEEDPMFGETTWEQAESEIQKRTAKIALEKAGLSPSQIDYLIGGDLLGQMIATSFGVKEMDIPFFGVYGACSTMGESLSLASILIDGGYADHVMSLTSSHNASAERQFRFPPAYGNQKPLAATWTVTGAGAVILSSERISQKQKKILAESQVQWEDGYRDVVVTGITTGKIVDYGIKDSMNMGAVMAPAACDVIKSNIEDLQIRPNEYDRIITGDLGKVGKEILLDLLLQHKIDISDNYMDCGIEIFHNEAQDTHSGGSGCGCSAVMLSAMILPKLFSGEWKKVLFLPTGALLSVVSFHEGKSVPAIAHGIVFESRSEKE